MDKDISFVLRKALEQTLFLDFDKYIDKTSNGISFNEKFFENAVSCLIRKFEDDKSIPSDSLHSEEFKKSLMDRFKDTDRHNEYPLLSSYYELQKFYMDPNNTGAEILDYDKEFFTIKDPLGRDYSYRTKDFMTAFYSMTKDMPIFNSKFVSDCKESVVNMARAYYKDEKEAVKEFDRTIKNGDVSEIVSELDYYKKEKAKETTEKQDVLPSSIDSTSKPEFSEPSSDKVEEETVLGNVIGEAWARTSVNRIRNYLNKDINYSGETIKFNKLLLERAVESIIEEMANDKTVSKDILYSEEYIQDLRKQLLSKDDSGNVRLFSTFKNLEKYILDPAHDESILDETCVLKDPNGNDFEFFTDDMLDTLELLDYDLNTFDAEYDKEMKKNIQNICDTYGVSFEKAIQFYNEQTGKDISSKITSSDAIVGYDNNGNPLYENDFTDYNPEESYNINSGFELLGHSSSGIPAYRTPGGFVDFNPDDFTPISADKSFVGYDDNGVPLFEGDFKDYEDDFEDYAPQATKSSFINGKAKKIDETVSQGTAIKLDEDDLAILPDDVKAALETAYDIQNNGEKKDKGRTR